VRPAAGEGFLQECLGEVLGPGRQRVHAAKARQPSVPGGRRIGVKICHGDPPSQAGSAAALSGGSRVQLMPGRLRRDGGPCEDGDVAAR
jgi:hypothetical protein